MTGTAMTVPQDLIERVRQATGPDRDLDHALWLHFDATAKAKHASGRVPLPWTWCLTSSVDDALALAERVLPGWAVAHIGEDYTAPPKKAIGWTVELEQIDGPTFQGQARTLPLAIVLATLLALTSQEPTNV